MRKIFAGIMAFALVTGVALAQGDKNSNKDKDKKKNDNSENYTVRKSGDAGGGSPTFSTGGLNPNPEKPQKDKPAKKDKKNKK